MAYFRQPAVINKRPATITNQPSAVNAGPRTITNQPLGGVDYRLLVTSTPCLLAIQADRGIDTSAATVASWLDQSGNGKDFSQGTAGVRPSYVAGALAGFPVVQFLTSKWMTSSFTRGAAGANPTWIWSIYRIDTWHATGADDVLYTDTGGAGSTLIADAVTPNMHIQCGASANINGGAAVGSWVRTEAWFNNSVSTSDYLKQGTSKIATGSAGNNACFTTAMKLGFSTAGRTLLHSLFAHLVFGAEPTAGEKAAMDAAATAQFGGLVAV